MHTCKYIYKFFLIAAIERWLEWNTKLQPLNSFQTIYPVALLDHMFNLNFLWLLQFLPFAYCIVSISVIFFDSYHIYHNLNLVQCVVKWSRCIYILRYTYIYLYTKMYIYIYGLREHFVVLIFSFSKYLVLEFLVKIRNIFYFFEKAFSWQER